jgi:hypothetical protein
MKTRMAFVGLLIAVPLQAQQMAPAPAPQSPRFTLGVTGGGASATGDLSGTSNWQTGWSAAANLTYRLSPKLGVRADVGFSQNDLNGTAAVPGAELRQDRRTSQRSLAKERDGARSREATPYSSLAWERYASPTRARQLLYQLAAKLGLGVGYSQSSACGPKAAI